MTWMQTHTGVAFDLANPDPKDVDPGDIAWALAHICRYNGHTAQHYSVAQHSLHISAALERDGYSRLVCLGGLLACPELAVLFKRVSDKIDGAICEAIGVDIEYLHDPAVEAYDRGILVDEAAALLGPPPRPWGVNTPQLGVDIIGEYPPIVAEKWLNRLAKLHAQPTTTDVDIGEAL